MTADSSFSELVEVWLADLDLEGGLAPSTRALYERNMRQLVVPAFEHYALREITIGRIEPFLKALAANKSCSYAKQAKTVLNLALGLAARYEAITKNPVREAKRMKKPPSQAVSLTTSRSRRSGWAPGAGVAVLVCPGRVPTVRWKRSSKSCWGPRRALGRCWLSANAT